MIYAAVRKPVTLLLASVLIGLSSPNVSALRDMTVQEIIDIAISGVGSPYVWGGACWDPNNRSWGGADCSGYVGKVWQVPRDSPVTEQYHPYTTWNFYNEQREWYNISRSDTARADAMVYRSGDSGHIILFDRGDPWGSVLAYEAKGTSYGIVHAWRTPSTSYQSRRRRQIVEPPRPLDSMNTSRSFQTSMITGSTAMVFVEYNNTGTEVWTKGGSNPVRLGTWNPQDRNSPFFTEGNWVGPSRPAEMDKASVASGETARFTFTMTAPETPGVYTECWRLVKEGTAWFGDDTVQFVIEVIKDQGSIQGTVLNQGTGNPVSGAVVSIDANTHTTANSSGWYKFTNIGPGEYTVTASYPGFAAKSVPTTVPLYETVTVDVDLVPGDSEPPTAPTDLTAYPYTSTQIILSWTASTDNIGVAGYKIFRDGVQVGTSASAAYTDSGLTPNTSYSYQVCAYDPSENVSELSNTAHGVTLPVTTAIFQDGFPDLNSWTAEVVADGTTRGLTWASSPNHASFTGSGSAKASAGSSSTNGSWSSRSFSRGFAAGKYEGWFYDNSTNNNSRQGLHLRGHTSAGDLVFSFFIGPQADTSSTNYCAGVYSVVEGGWRSWKTLVTRSIGWRKFTIEVLPYNGINDLRFYVDDVLRFTTGRPSDSAVHAITKAYIGNNYNVNREGWYDDVAFYAVPPMVPSMGTPQALSTSSIRWNFTDSSNNESGFDLLDLSENLLGSTAANSGFIAESGLSPNTRYVRRVRAYNGTLRSALSAQSACLTLSIPPSASNVVGDRSPGTWYGMPDFVFTAVGGFGEGTVQYYRYAWTQSPAHSWTGSEPQWGENDLSVSAASGGTWYLHVKGFNGDDVEHGSLTLGPYLFDSTLPSPPEVTDEGKYTGSTTELAAHWTASSDPDSEIAKYWYAIGSTPGGDDVVGWTETAGLSVTRSDLSLEIGRTYYLSVKAENELGVQGEIGVSDGITVVQAINSIAEAKALPDETLLALNGNLVSADFGYHFYIQDMLRTSGLRVEAESPAEGREVSVAGRLTTHGGERSLAEATVKVGPHMGAPIPLFMLGRNLGGSDLNPHTPGVTGGIGTNNLGLLVTVAGRVTHEDEEFCYVDDGSALQDGSGHAGVKVDVTMLSIIPTLDQYVRITGISSVEVTESDRRIRILRPRRDTDLTIY